MKKAFLISLVLFCGCQLSLEHSQRELRDHAKSLQVFKNTLPVRADQVGVAVGYFGRESITGENIALIDEFLVLAQSDPNGLSEYELAYSYGLGLRLYENMLRQCWLEIQGYRQ